MPLRYVSRIPDAPIIVAIFTGEVNAEMVQEMYRRSAVLIHETGVPAWRITDFRKMETTPQDALEVLTHHASRGLPGSTTDPRIRPVIVGDNQWVQLARLTMRQEQFGGVEIPIFDTVDEALRYVRGQIETTLGTRLDDRRSHTLSGMA